MIHLVVHEIHFTEHLVVVGSSSRHSSSVLVSSSSAIVVEVLVPLHAVFHADMKKFSYFILAKKKTEIVTFLSVELLYFHIFAHARHILYFISYFCSRSK